MRTIIVAVASSLVTIAFLTKCSVPNAMAGGGGDAPDAADTSDGGTPPDRSGLRSGSRLKMRVLSSADGTRAPMGLWWDSELQLECAVSDLAGEWRCWPMKMGVAVRYLDTNCTQPVTQCAQPNEYVRDLRTDQIYRIGKAVPSNESQVYRWDGDSGGCLPISANSSYCEMGEVVSRDTFVRLTPETIE